MSFLNTSSSWWPIARTVLLLVASNVFMTFAWYGHLRIRGASLLAAILMSWGIAFFEYVLQVPANRMGYGVFTGYQLKIIQECIALCVFIGFAAFYLQEPFELKHAISFALIIAAVAIAY